jgi:single-strand DNA-binding protein
MLGQKQHHAAFPTPLSSDFTQFWRWIMASFNQVILVGNLTRDPQVKQLPNQMTVTEFGIASNRRFRTASGEDREEVTFVDCAAFGKQGETIKQYCAKGKPLLIQGRLKYDQWDDKQGGGKRSKLSVVVENFQFIGGRESDAPGPAPSRGNGNGAGWSGNLPERRKSGAPEQPFGDEPAFVEADIPF